MKIVTVDSRWLYEGKCIYLKSTDVLETTVKLLDIRNEFFIRVED